jgi:DNA-binding MarR family transcriptional regulator
VLLLAMSLGRTLRSRLPNEITDPALLPLLWALGCDGNQRLSDLAVRLRLDASTVSRYVARLEKLGLAHRTEDPMTAGPPGSRCPPRSACHRHAMQRRREVVADALSGWSPADRETLRGLLSRLAADVEQAPERRDRVAEPTR